MSESLRNTRQLSSLAPDVLLTETPAYEQSLVYLQLRALEEAIVLCEERERLILQLTDLHNKRQSIQSEIVEALRPQESTLQHSVASTSRLLKESQLRLQNNRSELIAREERVRSLEDGRFSTHDHLRLERARNAAAEEHHSTLQRLQSELKNWILQYDRLKHECKSLELRLATATKELDSLNNRQTLPTDIHLVLKGAESRACQEHTSKLMSTELEIQSLRASIASKEAELSRTDKQIEVAQENATQLARIQSQGLMSRLSSSIWWGSFVTNFKKQSEISLAKRDALRQTFDELTKHLQQTQSVLDSHVTSKQEQINQAIEAEFQLQRTIRQELVEQIPPQINQLRLRTLQVEANQNELQRQIKASQLSVESSCETATRTELRRIVEEAMVTAQAAKQRVLESEEEEQAAKLESESAHSELSEFKRSCDNSIQDHQQQLEADISVVQERLEAIAKELEALITQNGLSISPPYTNQALLTARESHLARIRKMQTNGEAPFDPPSEPIPSKQTGSGSDNLPDDESLSSTNSEGIESPQRLYIDLERNADETTTSVSHMSRLRSQRQGQFKPGWVPNNGLRDQLLDLRRRIGETFFPEWSPDTDILYYFQDLFFPDGFSSELLFSNISLEEGFTILCVRPNVLGPRAQRSLPNGMSLAVCGHLFDNRTNIDNPVLLVQRIVEMSTAPPRRFEQARFVVTVSQPEQLYPASHRHRNILNSTFVTSLLPISVRTRERLKDWRAYLDWKDRLIQANLDGLRFLTAEVLPESQVRFLTVSASQRRYEECKKLFKKDELRAFELDYSTDQWNFKYNEKHRVRGRDIELGDFVREEQLKSIPNENLAGIAWDNPFAAYVYFRLNDDDQNEFDALSQNESVADAVASFQDRMHKTGFLALSVVGDVALVNRQRREIEQLQQQSGYAPFLSSYLFDIGAANVPKELVDISENQWFRDDLNEDQKQAVRTMISAPDLAMVQGPPGTGKTTMIAEATYQLTRQGKKVLLASQANLAVDNALERLAQSPSIRAIRLGRKGEQDHPYSQINALNTYYSAIAETCRNRTLDTWHRAEREQDNLNRWLSDADLIAQDIVELQTRRTQLETQHSQRKAEWEQLQNVLLQADRHLAERAEVNTFLQHLDGCNESPGSLPEDLLSVFYETIALPINRLRQFGICLNSYWFTCDQGDCRDRAEFASGIVTRWRRLMEWLPKLEGDLKRLEVQDGEQMLSAKDAFHVSELQHQLQRVQEEMVEDGSKLTEYQSLQRQIRDIKRRGSGLDKAMYEQVFNECCEPPVYRKYIDPSASRSVIVDELRQATTAIRSIQTEIDRGLEIVRAKCSELVNSPPNITTETGNIRRLEGQLRDLNGRLTETTGLQREKEQRLGQLIQLHLGCDRRHDRGESPLQGFNNARQAVKERLDELNKQLLQTNAFRNAWEPLLEEWVKDLTNPKTNANDQHYFLPTYIAACNVVGTTCTENRRTLEDAGHTRFDVVIVDEVSKATPPELIMPLMLGQTAILVGDHRQLPPLFKEQGGSWEEVAAEQEENIGMNGGGAAIDDASELTSENLERFKKMVTASLFKEHFENAPASLKSFLFTQYRMHPQIMRVVNQFYENRLNCGLEDPDGEIEGSDSKGHRLHRLTLNGPTGRPYLNPDQHVLWIDSTFDPYGDRHYERRAGTSKVNDLEATIIAKMLCDMEIAYRSEGYGRGGKNPKQIGVVTFYGRQVRNIREAVSRAQVVLGVKFEAIRYDINTVDRYQGQERAIVIVSMVRNPFQKLSQRANTAQFERVNVAFSRAQELLIVIGAKDVFCRYPVTLPHLDGPGSRKVEVYRLIIDEIQRNGGYWSSGAVLGKDEASRLLQSHDARLNTRSKR